MERFKNLIRKAIAVDAEKIIVYAGQKPALCQNQQVVIAEDQDVFDEKLFSTIFKTVLPKKDRSELTEPAEGMINIPGLGKLCVIGLAHDPAIILYMPKAMTEAKNDLTNLEQFKSSWPYFQPEETDLSLEDTPSLTFSVDLTQTPELPSSVIPSDLPAPPLQMAPPQPDAKSDFDPASAGFNFAMGTSTSVEEQAEDSKVTEGETSAENMDQSMGLGGLAWGDSIPAEMRDTGNPSQPENVINDEAIPDEASLAAPMEAPAFALVPPEALSTEVEAFPEESNEFEGISDQDFNSLESMPAVPQTPQPGVLPMPPRNHQANQLSYEPASDFVSPAPQAPREIDFGPDDPTLNGKYNKVMIDDLLIQMISMKSSDLHLTLGQKIIYRIDGEITRIDSDVITPEVMRDLLDPIIPPRNRAEFLECNDTDFAYAIPEVGRFRVNIFRDRNGAGSVIRHIPSKIMTMEQLKVPPVCKSFCDLSKGLVLVTGPTGSGKSTTLAAMLDHINRTRSDHLITVEDPIEFVHPQIKCLVNQREVHRHTQSFSRALRAALREDPDIVLIGEMRDLETIAIAIETAETGHLVFGTLHTTTAVSTVDRIIDQFPADRQEQIRMMLSSSLKGVVSQTLVKKIGGGRVAAQEILITDDAVAAMIREGKNHMINNHLATQKSAGNQLLNTALLQHVQAGNITADDAYLKAVDKKGMIAALQRANIKFNPPSETLKAS